MSDAIQHIERFRLNVMDVLSASLDAGDLDRVVEVRIFGDEIVIDLETSPTRKGKQDASSTPVLAKLEAAGNQTQPEIFERSPSISAHPAVDADTQAKDQGSNETVSDEQADKLKGGILSRRAAMICQQGAFAVFLKSEFGVAHDADPVLSLKKLCGVTSRAHLDHDFEAAENFKRIETAYDLWMRG